MWCHPIHTDGPRVQTLASLDAAVLILRRINYEPPDSEDVGFCRKHFKPQVCCCTQDVSMSIFTFISETVHPITKLRHLLLRWVDAPCCLILRPRVTLQLVHLALCWSRHALHCSNCRCSIPCHGWLRWQTAVLTRDHQQSRCRNTSGLENVVVPKTCQDLLLSQNTSHNKVWHLLLRWLDAPCWLILRPRAMFAIQLVLSTLHWSRIHFIARVVNAPFHVFWLLLN